MTNKTPIKEINDQYKGKRFMLTNDHPHAGQKVRVLEFSTIKGCKEPGLLVKNFRSGKESQEFRVFDFKELLFYPW